MCVCNSVLYSMYVVKACNLGSNQNTTVCHAVLVLVFLSPVACQLYRLSDVHVLWLLSQWI